MNSIIFLSASILKQLLPNIQKPNVLIYHDSFNDNDINNCIKIAKFCKIILIAIN